jgi:hypothetical protein
LAVDLVALEMLEMEAQAVLVVVALPLGLRIATVVLELLGKVTLVVLLPQFMA